MAEFVYDHGNTHDSRPVVAASCIAVIVLATVAGAGSTLEVVSVEPVPHSLANPVNGAIVIHFAEPVDRSSVTGDSFGAFGRWSGSVLGSFRFSDGDSSVSLVPDRPLFAGESVMVVLSHDLRGVGGSPMRSAGYSFNFWTRAEPANRGFTEIQRMTTRTFPGVGTRAYGGIATDLNRDGYPDLTIVHEDSADLRVFMSRADGTGEVDPFAQPTFPIGDRASPSEPADFDRDGNPDICVADINDDTVSILLGNGDGTYAPRQVVPVGADPRGIAVLDADGDGDVDIVNTNSGEAVLNMSILLNDGNGVFGPANFFAAGAANAWALAAGDMDDDGILDLVIGARSPQQMIVQTGKGEGTFTPASTQAAGGPVWMVVLGDVDGNGTEDVCGINSTSDTGSILLGDGSGGLGAPLTYPTDPFGLATDLGDIDGDGDLDWVASSFQGDWWVYTNDGSGNFSFDQERPSTIAASCALMVDLDNDGDLDLALIDEIEDEVILEQNDGSGPGAFPPGVPAGGGDTIPLTVAKLGPAGVDLSVSWDALTCTGAITGYQILYGGGTGFPTLFNATYALDGSACDIGTTPPYVWAASPDPTSDPMNLIWFLVVATDGGTTEGSWGKDGEGNERPGRGPNGASDRCGITDKSLSNPCGN